MLKNAMLGGLMTLGAACWLCLYPVGLVLAGLVVLLLVPQGHELLEATARHDEASFKAIFHASMAAWALSAWYCSRILLQQRFEGRFASRVLASEEGFVRLVRAWLPRLLGASVYLGISAHLFFVANERGDGMVVFALGIAYFLFVLYRRALLREGDAGLLRSSALSRATRAVLAVSLALSAALLAGFLASDVELPRRLGAAPIILLAFSSWILFGSIVLVLLPKAYGLPSLALLPLLLVFMAGCVDNHEVRQLPPDPQRTRAASIQADALAWLKQHEAEFRRARAEGQERFPVYIVAAEGGGLRAAYWTGSVLGELEAATEGRFSRRLYAISSVSGGSLGGAAFVAELAPKVGCNTPEAVSVRNCVRYFLKGDFLAPMVAYLLFPDLLQRFIPMPMRSFDRARALEHAWEASWAQTHPRAPANPFSSPYGAFPEAAPRLFLNSARVETGKRVLVSPARFDEDELPEVDDLLAVGGKPWSLPLSAAVHLSARFAYVSPAAKICKDAGATCDVDDVWGRLVDGGYHENSGAQTAEGLLRALRRAARQFEAAQPPGRTRIEAQVVIITNDAASVRLCDATDSIPPGKWYAEFLSPVAALWNARTARGGQARRALADAAAGYQRDPFDKDCEADGTRARTLEFAVGRKGGTEQPPALGWFLATGSTARMDQALCRDEHVRAFTTARRDLGLAGSHACR